MVTLTIPVLNRPDLLAECVASIDIECRLLLIDNSPEVGMGDVAEAALPDGVDLWVVEPPTNIGYTAAVNFAITTQPREPYWLVANADTVFGPGDLQRLIDEPGGWVGINGDWRVFKLTAETVERVGLWDENFHPAYCEDADYERRCDLAGIDRHFITGTTSHVGSVDIRSDERYARGNARSYPANVAYYQAKWGTGIRQEGGYTTPFDRGGSLADWTLDLARLRDLAW